MSAQEIIAELPKLKPDELRLVKARVDDLARRNGTSEPGPDVGETTDSLPAAPTFLQRVLEQARPRDWPADYPLNHAHYTKGEPKR